MFDKRLRSIREELGMRSRKQQSSNTRLPQAGPIDYKRCKTSSVEKEWAAKGNRYVNLES